MRRPAYGFEGLYEVSDDGQVIRVAGGRGSNPGRILRLRHDRDGYNIVDLRKNGRYMTVKVHRLVLQTFIGPSEGREVNHINGVKDDNRLENLQWVTHRDNIKHAVESGLMPDNYAHGPRGPLAHARNTH